MALVRAGFSCNVFLRCFSIPPQEPQTHGQQAALKTACEYEQAPSTPAPRTQPRRQARGKDETPRRLYAHHGHGQAARLLQPPRHKDLGNVLDGGEGGGQQAEEVGPGADVRRSGIDEDDGAKQGHDEEGERGSEDDDGFFPRRQIGVLLVELVGLGLAREEDEEQKHAGQHVSGRRKRGEVG
jgi:hypothetical protein